MGDRKSENTELDRLRWEIRERREAEEALRKSEERFRMLFECAPDGYYLNDLTGDFVDGNQAAEQITGYKRDELIGRSMLELNLVPESELPKVAEAVSQNAAGLPSEIHGLMLRRKDGSLAVVDVRSYPMKLGGQDLVLGIARDITERERIAREKVELEGQLRQVQKMEAVGQLAGGVAHEINNPLGVILGYAQSLCKRLPDEHEFAGPLRSIEKEAQRCRRLVSDLLAFSRKSAGQYGSVDSGKLLESAFSLLQNQTRIKNVELKVLCPDDLPEILGDFNWLVQVLVNLGTNAIDAMPQGGSLTFEARLLGPQVQIRVIDTGLGMSKEVRERVFEPFFTTKDVGNGTGLGLSLAYKIVQEHGGDIACHSRPGEGSIFQIILPVAP